jgi:hypothetical protein
MAKNSDPKIEFLRHALATVAYRGAKAMRGAPAEFAEFAAPNSARTPVSIVAHIGDLYDWALSLARGKQAWKDSKPLSWEQEVARFHATLAAFDAHLASGEPLATSAEELFQGPVADSLTHIGQLTLLRRIAGAPIRAENYAKADIVGGRVGSEQTAPSREF